ncbi:hypothetical protein AVEN_105496-1 [Araneus ventricosus]|uniref:RNase H type-1 domain-containing protein n=1 Tax=Araneus ventricosus TaxID=182803 RepID=A0A4Y2GJ17_ARAVE|nr:hypothetical protein AVEN_105496-1 [Araneus ventricosus]
MALKSASSRSRFVTTAKKDLHTAKHLVSLSWVKAHIGIQGNELADQHAKLAISTGEELVIPAPRSFKTENLKITFYIPGTYIGIIKLCLGGKSQVIHQHG